MTATGAAGLVMDDKRRYFVHCRLNEKTLAAWRAEIDKLLAPEPVASPNTKGTKPCAAATTRSEAAKSRGI